MEIELNSRKVVLFLLAVVGLIFAANVAALFSEFGFGHNHVFGLIPLIAVDQEQNVPTYFSSGLWLACAAVSFAIAAVEKRNRRSSVYWMVIAFISLYISVDEFVAFHERVINARVRGPLATRQPFYVSWVLVYGVVVVGVALTLGRFVIRLPSEIRRLFIVAGIGYVIAAIGFEEISGLYLESHDWRFGLGYGVITLIEETLEMGAVITFLYALMLYAGKHAGGVGVRIGSRA